MDCGRALDAIKSPAVHVLNRISLNYTQLTADAI